VRSARTMQPNDLGKAQFTTNQTEDRVRRCGKCGGELRCKTVVEWRVNRGYAGRDYTFICQGCKQIVTVLSPYRTIWLCVMLVLWGGLAGMLVTFGVRMLIDLLTKGPGGNDLSALILVIAVFLGLGIPFALLLISTAKELVSDWLKLLRNPVIR